MKGNRGYGQASAASDWWGGLLLLFVILLGLCAIWIWAYQQYLQLQWVAVSAIIIGMCMFAGWMVNGRVDGILIDDRNRVSLSRLQWVAWFIVLLGGYYVGAVWNVGYLDWKAQGHFPTMQPDLWALLGIVSASAVASSLIVGNKKSQDGRRSTGQAAAASVAPAPAPVPGHPDQAGRIDRNVTPSEASWADLFLGEEVTNRDVVDVSRLQKLFITVLLLVTYIRLLWTALGNPDSVTGMNMPNVADDQGNHGFLWLLGISHAAYLAYKASPKSGPGTQSTPSADLAGDESTDGCDVDFTVNPTQDNQLPAASGGVAS
jgi:hypothetical protein